MKAEKKIRELFLGNGELSCNHCGKWSSSEEVTEYARSLGFDHNTTCPKCNRAGAFAKLWLFPDGSRRVSNVSIPIPFKEVDGGIIPDKNSADWPKNGDAILIIHPRDA